MNIKETIAHLLANSDEIIKSYPTVENIRHVVKDVPYADLKAFAATLHKSLSTDLPQNRAYIIYSPILDGIMHTDIWLYSTVIKIKPAEIIEE